MLELQRRDLLWIACLIAMHQLPRRQRGSIWRGLLVFAVSGGQLCGRHKRVDHGYGVHPMSGRFIYRVTRGAVHGVQR